MSYYLKADIEKYFCAKRNEDIRDTNGLQNVGEKGFDSLGYLVHPLPLCSTKMTDQVKAALCVAAVCLGGRY